MAKLLGQVSWDPKTKKVVTTYQVLQVEPNKDKIQLTTTDSQPFIIQTKRLSLVKRLGLQKAKNADGRNDLYQVQKTPQPDLHWSARGDPASAPKGKALNCGTLDKDGHFVPWGPGIPLDGG